MKPRMPEVSSYFDRDAIRFDAIYGGASPSPVHRLVDNLFRRKSLRLRMEQAAEMIPDGSSCLDVGSGSGRVAVHLALEKDCRVTGVDVSKQMIDLSVRLAEEAGCADRCTFILGDYPNVEGLEATECVLMLGLIDYAEDAGELVKSALDLANDRVVLSYPKPMRILNPVRKIWLQLRKGVSIRFFSDAYIDGLAKSAGGRVTSRRLNRKFPFFEDAVVTIEPVKASSSDDKSHFSN